MQRRPLPEEIAGESFLTRDAVRLGVSHGRLFAGDLRAPYHGVRAPADQESMTAVDRCREYLPRLGPLQFYSHSSGAAVWGIPLPARFAHDPLHVSSICPSREPRTEGVVGHRARIDAGVLTLVGGLPVAPPAETWAQLGCHLFDRPPTGRAPLTVDALIVAADHLLHEHLADRAELESALARVRRRGAVSLTAALADARAGAESPKETETRLAIVRAGLPEPLLNWVLRDAHGRFVARLDMAYPRYRLAVEYDGRHHADHEQFVRDADRWAALEAEGWMLVRVLSHHLREPQRHVAGRVRAALITRGWAPRPVSVHDTRNEAGAHPRVLDTRVRSDG